MLHRSVQVQCVYILLKGGPVSIPRLILADPLMCTVAGNPRQVEIVGRVGGVQDVRGMSGDQSGVLP